MLNSREKGKSSENKAAQFLMAQGYAIKETNWTAITGEIDIIGYDRKTLVFIEVKYRGRNTFGLPQEAVHFWKQKKIIQTALAYLKKNGLKDTDVRFDVVSICGQELELIKNAFQSPGNYWW